MTAAEHQLVRFTPVELVDAVRAGRIRYPNPGHPSATDTARVLDGIHRRYPQRALMLWRDPADMSDGVLWLVDGGDLVSALLLANGITESRPSDEPVLFDTDTGEIVSWGQRPDRAHVTLDVRPLLAAEDPESYLAAEHLTGVRADRVLAFLGSLRELHVPVQVVELPKTELPMLFRHLPMRRGTNISEIGPPVGPRPGPPASWYAWGPGPRALVSAARELLGFTTPAEDVWRLLLVAEGRDPGVPYDEAACATDLPDDGRSAVAAVRDAQHVLRGIVGFASGGLLPDLATLAVVARFLRVFPTVDEAAWPLLRRWVWRAALTDTDLDLSPEALAVIRDDAASSAVRLLHRANAPNLQPPGREALDTSARRGRLILLGLASLHPRDLPTGVLVDIEEVRPKPILPDRPIELANLMFHDHVTRAGLRTVLDAIVAATDTELLATHGIDGVAVDLLRARDDDGFLARRAALLDRVVPDFWTTMAEPSAATRRPVALLFEDDHAD